MKNGFGLWIIPAGKARQPKRWPGDQGEPIGLSMERQGVNPK